MIAAAFNQGDINHITGDIHFAALLLRKRKTILTIHDIGSTLNNKNILRKWILRLLWYSLPMKRVKYITVISEFTRNEIIKNFKVSPEKIIIIPDCVSENFKPQNNTFDISKPNILQVGTKENKNTHRLFVALKNIPCRLHLVGELTESQINQLNEYKTEYKNYCNLSQSEIIELYQNSDLVSFVSTYEGFGVPILEAQSCGKPVITSNISPMKEVAGNGALLVDPENAEEIKTGILKIIHNSEYRNKLIQNGFENVEKYSAQNTANQYYELYDKIFREK
jgi:glycosyltransferase involved in cell wall biosynthesis